jgi:hypothetical protein
LHNLRENFLLRAYTAVTRIAVAVVIYTIEYLSQYEFSLHVLYCHLSELHCVKCFLLRVQT